MKIMAFFLKKGGLEICRIDDDERWEELKERLHQEKHLVQMLG